MLKNGTFLVLSIAVLISLIIIWLKYAMNTSKSIIILKKDKKNT